MSTVDYCSLSAKYAISMKSVRITESAKFSPMQTQKAFSTKPTQQVDICSKLSKENYITREKKLNYTRRSFCKTIQS